MSAAPIVSNLGGKMYGDGEFVLEFDNAGSMLAPLMADVADLRGSSITVRELTFAEGTPATIDTARKAIALVRAQS